MTAPALTGQQSLELLCAGHPAALARLKELMLNDARYRWLADKVLACDYGDNETNGAKIGWRIRHCKGPERVYGASIDAAIDAAIAEGGR